MDLLTALLANKPINLKFCIVQSENKERLLQEVKMFTEQIKEEKRMSQIGC